MEFMLVFTKCSGGDAPDPARLEQMVAYAAELAEQGKLRRGGPLTPPTAGAQVRVREGNALVSDGPFAESKEQIGGFWIIEAASREEAVEIAKRVPHARWGTVELHATGFRDVVKDSEAGKPFLLVFRMEPGLTDPDGAKFREMVAFGDLLKPGGTFVETSRLADTPAPARIEVHEGKPLVVDGPFAEAKEAVGGYAIVRVPDRAAAIELATRYPHARWGPVEVREILFFHPV